MRGATRFIGSRLAAACERREGALRTQLRAEDSRDGCGRDVPATAPEPVVVGTFPSVPFGLGIWEILILAGVLVLLFGAKGAPAMARRLGTGVREMKDAVTDMDPRSLFDPKDEPAEAVPMRELEAATKPQAPPVESTAPAKPEGEPPAS